MRLAEQRAARRRVLGRRDAKRGELAAAASVSQSVVQAGDRLVRMRALMPARARAVSISSVIMSIAGQPE